MRGWKLESIEENVDFEHLADKVARGQAVVEDDAAVEEYILQW